MLLVLALTAHAQSNDLASLRKEVYDAETKPVLAHYDRKVIADVNAIGTPAEVLMHTLQAIVPAYNKHCGNPLDG